MKKTAGLLITAAILLSFAVPVFGADSTAVTDAAAPTVVWSDEYLDENTAFLGWDGTPVSIAADGVWKRGAADEASFGAADKTARAEYSAGGYPVVSSNFFSGILDYSFTAFCNAVKAGDAEGCAVYYRLTLTNSTKAPAAYPVIGSGYVSLSDPPKEIPAGGSVTADYVYSVPNNTGADTAALTAEQLRAFGSYDDNYEIMRSHWDALLAKTVKITGIHSDDGDENNADDALRLCYILTAIGVKDGGFSTADVFSMGGALSGTLTASDSYSMAVYLLSGGSVDRAEKDFDKLNAVVKGFEDSIMPVSGFSGDGVCSLIATKDGELILTDNLDALLEIRSYIYVCTRLTDLHPDSQEYSDALSAAQNSYNTLLLSVEKIMKNTVSACDAAWEATDLEGSSEDGIFTICGENRESAAALAEFYVLGSRFTATASSSYLNSLAKEADAYIEGSYDYFDNAAFFVASLVKEREDGTVVIGQGMPARFLTDGAEISVDNVPLGNSKTVSCTFSVSDETVKITVETQSPVSVTVEIPALRGNIEYSSCGFDAETGIVSVPAGTSEVTLRLAEAAESVCAANTAASRLEREIFLAGEKNTSGCTEYSARLFAAALADASEARTAPSDGQESAADALNSASAALSPIISGYTVTCPENASVVPTAVLGESINQLFYAEDAGRISEIRVMAAALPKDANGVRPTLTATVFSLRDDGLSPDKLLGEAVGTVSDGWIVFDMNAQVDGGTYYAVCLESEGELYVCASKTDDNTSVMYSVGDSTTCYTHTALVSEITVTQADRTDLDTFFAKCESSDTSAYTKESLKRLNDAMEAAGEALCSSVQSIENYDAVYGGLKSAYSSLATYASDAPVEQTPAALYILLGVAAILLLGAGATAVVASRKRYSNKEK